MPGTLLKKEAQAGWQPVVWGETVLATNATPGAGLPCYVLKFDVSSEQNCAVVRLPPYWTIAFGREFSVRSESALTLTSTLVNVDQFRVEGVLSGKTVPVSGGAVVLGGAFPPTSLPNATWSAESLTPAGAAWLMGPYGGVPVATMPAGTLAHYVTAQYDVATAATPALSAPLLTWKNSSVSLLLPPGLPGMVVRFSVRLWRLSQLGSSTTAASEYRALTVAADATVSYAAAANLTALVAAPDALACVGGGVLMLLCSNMPAFDTAVFVDFYAPAPAAGVVLGSSRQYTRVSAGLSVTVTVPRGAGAVQLALGWVPPPGVSEADMPAKPTLSLTYDPPVVTAVLTNATLSEASELVFAASLDPCVAAGVAQRSVCFAANPATGKQLFVIVGRGFGTDNGRSGGGSVVVEGSICESLPGLPLVINNTLIACQTMPKSTAVGTGASVVVSTAYRVVRVPPALLPIAACAASSYASATERCLPCPAHALCAGGLTAPLAEAKFSRVDVAEWALRGVTTKNTSGEPQFVRCPVPDTCLKQLVPGNRSCIDGFTGWMCTQCDCKFYKMPWCLHSMQS